LAEPPAAAEDEERTIVKLFNINFQMVLTFLYFSNALSASEISCCDLLLAFNAFSS
jgi:hypothetical protein